ncbi:MAG: recombinase family protein [Myxococcales bacterium]|nr:recombinase family protein [Myxococcales bacterium]
MIPIAIYARYSTDKQDARSIDDQLRRCREYAERNGYEVVAEFTDAATSGAHTERANLRRMLDVATATKRPPFKAVIVDDLSRLSRDLGDTWRIIFTDLAAVDIKVIDASTGMASDASGARTMFAAMAMVNDTFLQLVRHETHRGLQGRAIAGFSTGGSLFGFKTYSEPNPSDREHPRKLWAIDEDTAPIVRRIFDMFDQGGYSYRAIADRLNREHVPAPRNNGRGGKHGNGWSHVSVRAILTNEKYAGRWRWNTSKWIRVPGKKARRQLARPESEHVVREYPELAIIDMTTWDRVQSRMRKHKRGEGTIIRQSQRQYLVSGLLRCGLCGGPMSIVSQKTKNEVRYANFGCSAYHSRGKAICANSASISEKKITEALLDALRDTLRVPVIAEAFAAAFEKRIGDRAQLGTGDLEKLLRAAETRVTNATRLIVEMPDDLDLRRQRAADQEEVRRLKSEIAAQGAAGTAAVPDRKSIAAATGRLLTAIAEEAPERGRAILAEVMGPLTLTPKEERPERFIEASGSVDLAKVAAVFANGSSGGRI